MEDYNSNLLNDSKNEWSIRLMNILSGHIIDGFRSIFNESLELCEKNDEAEKYLMTFQNFLSKIPNWNQTVINNECERIKNISKCEYLEDLITCVHVIQLKILSCVRTNNQNKKIDINIPSLNNFLHVLYINIARKLYSNIYLFQIDNTPLEQQKNNREFELIVQSCILNTIRDNIPIEDLLKQYIDETQEIDVIKTEKIIPKKPENTTTTTTISASSNSESTNVEPTNTDESTNAETNKIFNENVTFNNNVEALNMENNEINKEEINFEPKNNSFDDDDDDDDDDDEYNKPLNIGSSIKLNLDNSTENENKINKELELEEINLNNINKSNNDIIDLGVEEIEY